jgi:hypothetical protein
MHIDVLKMAEQLGTVFWDFINTMIPITLPGIDEIELAVWVLAVITCSIIAIISVGFAKLYECTKDKR